MAKIYRFPPIKAQRIVRRAVEDSFSFDFVKTKESFTQYANPYANARQTFNARTANSAR